jgi:hypothetical protein
MSPPVGPVTEQFVFSGSLSDGQLSLTGGANGKSLALRLSGASVDAFNSATSVLSKKAELMQQAQTIEGNKTRLEAIVQHMVAFNARADQDVKNLPMSEERLRQLTQRMGNALARQQAIPAIDRTAVARGQIGIAINQAGVETSQFHLLLQSKQAEFRKTSSSFISDAV